MIVIISDYDVYYGSQDHEHMRKLFIGGLNPKTDDDSMRSYFSTYGNVVDCIVMKDNQTKRFVRAFKVNLLISQSINNVHLTNLS